MSLEQRQDIVIWRHWDDPNVRVINARAKYNRRHRLIVCLDGDQILREWWPGSYHPMMSHAKARAMLVQRGRWFLEGYVMGRSVWRLPT